MGLQFRSPQYVTLSEHSVPNNETRCKSDFVDISHNLRFALEMSHTDLEIVKWWEASQEGAELMLKYGVEYGPSSIFRDIP